MIMTGIHPKPVTYVPKEHVKFFETYDESSYRLFQGDDNHKMVGTYIGVKKNDKINLSNNYFTEVFELDHSVPTVGYGIQRKSDKLKKEYIGKTGKEISILRQTENIFETIYTPLVAYLCDTTPKVFSLNKEIFNYPYVMVECTFLDDKTYDLAQSSKHTHWKDLKPIIEQYPDIIFILIHFSMRYDNIDIPDAPKNVILYTN